MSDLIVCPSCGQKRYDAGVGCERRSCAFVKPEDRLCFNCCEVGPDNPVLADGLCQACHDYPEG